MIEADAWEICRGNCYTKRAGNIGLVLRRAVAQGIRVMGDDDMDVCCSGVDAPEKVLMQGFAPSV